MNNVIYKYLGEFDRKRYLLRVVVGICFGIVGIIYQISSQINADPAETFLKFTFIAECFIYGIYFILKISKVLRGGIIGFDMIGLLVIIVAIMLGCIIGGIIGGILFAIDTLRLVMYLSNNEQETKKQNS